MKKIFALLLCIGSFANVFALKTVNGREIPESEDFSTFGSSFQNKIAHYDSILTETANLMGATVGGDDIDVDEATITTANITGILTGNLKHDSIVVNTDGAETVTAAQTGALFVSTKSDGATTYTLPDATSAINGCIWTFFQTADQNMVVTATTADNNDFVADAVATSDQVSAETASHKIGSGIVVYGANSKYYAFALNPECPLTVEAAD